MALASWERRYQATGSGLSVAVPAGAPAYEDSPGSSVGGGGDDGSPRHGLCAFAGPLVLVVDPTARSLFVCDVDHHAVRRVDLDTGGVSTIDGSGCQGIAFGAEKSGSAQRLSSWDAVHVDLPVDGSLTPHLLVAMAGVHQLWALPLDVTVYAAPRGGRSGAPTPPDRLASARWNVYSGTGREAQRDDGRPRRPAGPSQVASP